MKKSNLLKSILLLSLICYLSDNLFSQTYVNKEWIKTTGAVSPINRTVTKTDASDNIIVVSNVLNGVNKSDVLVTKYNHAGLLLWQKTFNGVGNNNDYGVQMAINSNDEIFVAAAIEGASSMDFGMLKYSPSGTLLMSRTWDGVANGTDIPADIIIDDNNNIYLVGGSQAGNGLSDYAIVKYDSSGTFQWHTDYDFANFHDAATSVTIDNTLVVTGASASSINNWDYATLQINPVNGNLIHDERTSVPGLGFDNALDVTSHKNNFYITGYVEVGGIRSIQTLKINANFGLVWAQTYDAGMNDEGNSVSVDNYGNVYVTGYSENGNLNGKDFITIKYDSLGNELWQQKYGSGGNPTEAIGKQLIVTSDNGVIVAGTVEENGNNNFATIKYNENGDMEFEEIFDNNNADDVVESVIDDGEDVYVTGISTSGTSKVITTVKYSYKDEQSNVIYVGGEPSYIENELLIRFDRSAINIPTINNSNIQFGILEDFINSSVLSAMENKTGVNWGSFETYKIFRNMSTADSISITRLGDTMKMEDFWATLSVYIPDTYNSQELEDSLNKMGYEIHFAEKDYIFHLNGVPNDSKYLVEQTGLSNIYPGINVEQAWDKQVGRTHTKVGVFDSGINWDHEDFGNGTQSGTKVTGGWNYNDHKSIFRNTNHDGNGHGTAVASIIGALRNNNKGVAGIAGGDVQAGNTGAQLFSMQVANSSGDIIKAKFVSNAIVEGSTHNPATGYGYGLHVQNHSWGGQQDKSSKKYRLLKGAVRSCYFNGCSFVAASGNLAVGHTGSPVVEEYPASFPDDWVVKVGGNDQGGLAWSGSVQGLGIDVVAPSVFNLYAAADHNSETNYTYNKNGTSFSAPHASGVIALLHSEHNVVNGYPNNLSPEDYEYALQTFAKDIPPVGYDQGTGYGIVNAKLALERTSLPKYYIKHSGGINSPTINLAFSNQRVVFINDVNNLASGTYFADRYEVISTFNESFPANQQILSYWKTYSSSECASAASLNTGEPYYFFTTSNVSGNTATFTTKTFCWYVKTDISGRTINRWYPASPSQLRTNYSLYIRDNSITNVEEKNLETNLKIFPNPASNLITLQYNLNEATNPLVEIIDAMGRVVLSSKLENQETGNQSTQINISNLANGIYFCKFTLGSKVITKRLVKN